MIFKKKKREEMRKEKEGRNERKEGNEKELSFNFHVVSTNIK